MDVSVKDEGIHLPAMILLQAKSVVQVQAGILLSKLKRKVKRSDKICNYFSFINMIHFHVGRGEDES